LVAGVALIPLAGRLAATLYGPGAGTAAALLVALHPYLVRSSAEVLAESLYGLLVVSWALLVLHPGAGRLAGAGALAAAAALLRREGIALVPLTAVAGSLEGSRRQRAGRALAALAASIVVLAPLVLAVQRATGEWGISGKEGPLIARMYGVAA